MIYTLIINYIQQIFNRSIISMYGKYYNASALDHYAGLRASHMWSTIPTVVKHMLYNCGQCKIINPNAMRMLYKNKQKGI